MPQFGRSFGTNNDRGAGRVSGAWVDKVGGRLNNIVQPLAVNFHNTLLDNPIGLQVPVVGIAEITKSLGSGLYECEFRYLDIDGKWNLSENPLSLDTSVYSSAVPKYAIGECVGAVWDLQSNFVLPFQSPPDQVGYISLFSRDGRKQVPANGCKGGSHDAVHLVLERYNQSTQTWKPLLPELILRPDSSRGMTTGSVPVTIQASDGDLLRLRYGTAPFSRSQMNLQYAGLSIHWLGRIHNHRATVLELDSSTSFVKTDGFATVQNLYPIAISANIFGDTPTISWPATDKGVKDPSDEEEDDESDNSVSSSGSAGSGSGSMGRENLLISMSKPQHQWAAEITIYAEVSSENITHFAKVTNDSNADAASPSDETQDGDLLEANSNGFFSATLIRDYDGSTYPDDSSKPAPASGDPDLRRELKIWLAFIDRWGKLRGDVIAEQGLVYGPVHYTGQEAEVATPPTAADLEEDPEAGSRFDERPIYAATIIKEEYFGKYSGNKNKGEGAEIRIYVKLRGTWKDTQIKREATFDFNDYKKETFCVVTRGPGGDLVANQIECKTSVSNSPQ